MSKSLAWSAAAAATMMLSAVARAQIVADFTGGSGTASSDQYVGRSGGGWNGAWAAVGTSTASTTVTSTGAFTGAGGSANYLKVVDDSSATTTLVRREYLSTSSVNINSTYTLSFSVRYDGNMAQFTDFGDRVTFFGDTTAQSSSSATNTWLVGVSASNTGAGAGQSVYPGEWFFFDNNGTNAFATANMYDTNLVFVGGREYDIVLIIDAATGTYSASIDDGVNPIVSATNLTFRRGAGAVMSDWVHFSTNASAAADSSGFSIDNIQITPEPASMTLLALGGLALLRRPRAAMQS